MPTPSRLGCNRPGVARSLPFDEEVDLKALTHPAAVLWAQPSRASEITVRRWTVAAAVRGSGSMLVGPHRLGATAFVPPGVLCLTPADREDRFAAGGWRQVIWGRDDGGNVLIDLQRPLELREIDVCEVSVNITFLSPGHRPWLLRQIQLFAICLDNLMVDGVQRSHDELVDLMAERDALRLDATRVAGERWVRTTLEATGLVTPTLGEIASPEHYEEPPTGAHTLHRQQ
jgi:hypothetical protein